MKVAVDQKLLLELTAGLVGKCIENGVLKPGEVPGFIATTYAAFAAAVAGPVIAAPEPEAWSPQVAAVAVEESVTDDYIICLEDGKRFKSMRGHLRKLDMSPEEYRAKWGLPHDYPMVARNYASKRSTMAKGFGLGVRSRPKAEVSEGRTPAKT